MTKEQAIQSVSYILGENVKGEFEEKEEKAVASNNSFFYVYNSENKNVRVNIITEDKRILYEVQKEGN